MHFHLPKPLHGWRELAGEVGIIVLGVLIALGADQAIEAWRLHRQMDRAEAAMRLELGEDNGPQAYGRVLIGPCLDAAIVRIYDGAGHVPVSQLRQWVLEYNPPYRSWDTEAWKTILGSDVGSHMGPERLILWSSAYRVLAGLTDRNLRERELVIDLQQSLPASGDASPSDLQALRRDAAQLRMINGSFYRASQLILSRSAALSATVPKATRDELLKDAREMYGDCARPPDPNAAPLAMDVRRNLGSPAQLFGD